MSKSLCKKFENNREGSTANDYNSSPAHLACGKKNVAVLISGGGTNLQAIIDAEKNGGLPNACVKLVVSSRAGVYGLERAANAGISNIVVPRGKLERLVEIFEEHEIDWVVLAGFLSVLPEKVVKAYKGKIINTHPALIPLFCGKGFYGLRVHEAVLASGMKVSGATIHFVDEGIDTGEILAQRAVDVLPEDTPEALQQRVLKVEHILLTEVLRKLTDPEKT